MNVDERLRRLEKALAVDTAAAGAPGGVPLIPELAAIRVDLEARALTWAAAHDYAVTGPSEFFYALGRALEAEPDLKRHVGDLLDRQREASRRSAVEGRPIS